MDAKEKDEKILYYLAKVVQDLALKNYAEIVKTIKELLEIDEKADYYGIIGLAEFKLGLYDESIAHLERAISISPRADYYCNLGMSRDAIKDKEGALEAYEKALELNPKSDYYYSNVASIKYDLGRYLEAADDYSKAIELGPHEDTYYGMRGLSKVRAGVIDDAIDDYKMAIKLNKKEIEYYYRLANIYLEKKDYENASKYYDEVLALCEANGGDALDAVGVSYLVKCYLRYARVKVAQGDYQTAQEMLSVSIKKDPKLDVDNAGD